MIKVRNVKTIRKLLKMWLNKIQRTVEQSEDNTSIEEYSVILNDIKTNNYE